MGILDKIKVLANEQALTLAELERKLDFSNGSLRKWETSTPSSDKIEKVADYFNVSTDYLLGRTDNPRIASDVVTAADGREVDLSNLRERVVMFDGKPLSDDDVEKIAQIIKLSLGVTDIENK
ncbi:helix-turn-helix domain-containing protein [Streptococcus sp. VTCC 12886]|uniref:helix-turn-helix domain-containing protein n=1 Tax=Streptococcus sp. VTCC 12886 TaxID=3413767 RepID=UPI003D9C726F